MLTKGDLTEIGKLIRKDTREVVREEIGNEVSAAKDEIQADITMSRMRVQTDIDELQNRIKNLEIKMTKMHRELKEEIKMVSNFLDKENVKTSKRVKRIEEHLRLPAAS